MSNTFSRKLDAVSKSRVVDLVSWSTTLELKAMNPCICTLRKFSSTNQVDSKTDRS
jgi:hypothetical protein